MATFLIPTSEEDSTLAVARQLAEYLNAGKEHTALAETPGSLLLTTVRGLLAESRNAELLELFLNNAALLFEKATSKDLECCLLVICNLVPKLPMEQQVAAVARTSSSFTEAATSHPEVCLQALVELYNIVDDASARYKALVQILTYARKSGLSNRLGPVIRGKAPEWVKEWGLGNVESRQLYVEVAATLKECKTKAAEAESFELRLKYLASFEGADASELPSARAVAAETAADFVSNPEMFKCDLYEMAAFKQLEADTEHVGVFQLLNIMVSGDLRGLAAFAKEHASVLAACNITPEDATLKTRLMALLGLCTEGYATNVSFDRVQEALAIGEDEVETWLVMAIGKKLIEGKINQLERTLLVTRSTQRTFGPQEWVALRQQLLTWQKNIAGVKALAGNTAAVSMQA